MNSIVCTYFAAPAQGASLLDVALHRLGVYIDAERDTLRRLLTQAGRRQAAGALDALARLRLEAGADNQDVRDLLEEAAQFGTAFVDCPESSAADAHRSGLAGPGGFHTRMTNIISGRPARALANRFTGLEASLGGQLPPDSGRWIRFRSPASWPTVSARCGLPAESRQSILSRSRWLDWRRWCPRSDW